MPPLAPFDPITATRPRPATPDCLPEIDADCRVVVADDHPLYRQGIVRALEAHGAFTVVAEAGDGADALELIRALEPDIALLDVRMPRMDGIDVIAALALHGPDIPVVLLSAFSDAPLVASGLEAGAAAYIDKTADRDAICLQLSTIAAAHGAFSPRRLHAADPLTGPRGWIPRLTHDEHELLRLAARGLGKRELADRLGLAEAEVRQRIGGVLRKLDTDSLQDAVARGRSLQLIR